MQTQLSMKPAGLVAPPIKANVFKFKSTNFIYWKLADRTFVYECIWMLTVTWDLNFWADQNFCPLVGDCGLQFAAKLEGNFSARFENKETIMLIMMLALVLRVMGHLSTSFLWLHWVAFMLITCQSSLKHVIKNEHYDLNAVKIAESITHKCRS